MSSAASATRTHSRSSNLVRSTRKWLQCELEVKQPRVTSLLWLQRWLLANYLTDRPQPHVDVMMPD